MTIDGFKYCESGCCDNSEEDGIIARRPPRSKIVSRQWFDGGYIESYGGLTSGEKKWLRQEKDMESLSETLGCIVFIIGFIIFGIWLRATWG